MVGFYGILVGGVICIWVLIISGGLDFMSIGLRSSSVMFVRLVMSFDIWFMSLYSRLVFIEVVFFMMVLVLCSECIIVFILGMGVGVVRRLLCY